jgi:peptidoglycan/LPS O-acetylase OafA/YrhL
VRDQLFMINPVSWSLFFELMVNILFVMLWRRLTPKFLWSVISASGMVIAAFTLYRHNASMGNFWRTSPIGVARTFFSFGLGILIYYGYRSGRLRVHAPLPVFLLAAAVLIIYLLIPVPPRIRACYDLAFIFLVAPTLVMIGASRHLENRWMGIFSFLGATSYALYATHANLIPLVMTLSARTFAAPPVWLISIASVCVATLLAYLLDMVYDKPVRSALAASFARNQPGRAIRT